MRRRLFLTAAGLCAWAALGLSAARAEQKAGQPAGEPACGDHGTSVKFYDSAQEAAKLAAKEQKLVFVLHVSGEFEDPGLT